MGEKEFATKKIINSLIGGFFLYSIPFAWLYNFVYSLICKNSDSLMFNAGIAIILQGIIVYLVWKCSTYSAFKEKSRTIYSYEVPRIMRSLIIFTILICIVTSILNFSKVDSMIDNITSTDIVLTVYDSYALKFYNSEQKAQYEAQKEKAISEAKSQVYRYLAVLEVGLLAVYLGVLPLEKKNILKYTIETNNSDEGTV